MAQRPIHDLERKWQEYWEKNGTYRAQAPTDHPTGDKFFGLIEFPYPSGEGLHVGHPRSYTAIDVVTRKRRMEGKNVLYPIGWDAFGLPTENFAIKHKIKPADATKKNVGNFTRQIKSLGFGFDWSREVNTSDPTYYKWTQWQFLQFVKAGLAYKAATTINWCPRCKIGLANEEAQGGVCERCGNPVEKREKAQWMIKITKYAERLLKDLDGVDYLDKIKKQQIDWIGKSEGAEVVFRAPKFERVLVASNNKSKITRAKKLLGAVLPSVQVVSPEEIGLAEQEIVEGNDLQENARAKARAYRQLTDLPILGMDTGLFISGEKMNPVSPKRNALGGADEASLTQEEKAKTMDAFYRSIAEKHGGEVEAYWKDATALSLPDGTDQIVESTRQIVITSQRKGEMDVYFPVTGLYKSKSTGKYHADHTDEEMIFQEFGPLTQAFVSLCSEEVRVFTTRPDTLFGVTYVVLAPEHALVQQWLKAGKIQNPDEVQAYIDQVKSKTDIERTAENKEKTGVALKGISVINPVNGESVPVWIADYALANYGTGAVMAVPAHDERDFAFANKFELPVRQVVAPFVAITGAYAPQPGKETTRKNVVTGIIYRPRTEEYLLLDVADGRKTFVGGGIESNESPEEAILREVQEETGYTNAQVQRVVVPAMYGTGYKPRKGVNCFDLDTTFYLEVEDEAQVERALEDQTAHQVIWKKVDEVASVLNLEPQQEAWRWFRENRCVCFTEEGKNMRSEFLNELSTSEAKEKIIEWLESHTAGKKLVTYRLRDWVFSRQRYWGEPIPLVHCEKCANKKQKALIIHGLGSHGNNVWHPKMKQELEKKGFEVFAPTMSTSSAPTFESWFAELKPYMDQLGEDDVIVAHSLGGKVALHLIEEAKKKIGNVYLVAPLIGPVSDEEWEAKKKRRADKDYDKAKKIWERPIDWSLLSSLIGMGHVFTSDDDTRVPHASHEIFPKGWLIHYESGKGHFDDPESPELIESVLSSKVSGWNPIPEEQLPLTLPEIEAYEPTDTGESPLAKIEDWVKTTCPKCDGPAKRETDTMPNWAGSSWYFLRYCDPHNDKEFASAEALKYWMPVNLYNGGMEHTTLHLLYSRFWHKFLWDVGHIPTECGSEPYAMRRSHNMILGEGGVKMSKSKGNVINPDDVVKDYGADVFRVYEMFIGPYDQPAPWDTNGIEGVRRFLDKVWNLFEGKTETPSTPELETLYHQTVKKVTEGIEHLQFNTCVSQMMILTNAFQDAGGIPKGYQEGFLQILAPYAPHLAEELWQGLGQKETIHRAGWPSYDASKLVGSTFELVIQINGKVRDKMVVETDLSEEEAKAKVLASQKIQGWLEGKEPKKIVYVKGKLVSIVV